MPRRYLALSFLASLLVSGCAGVSPPWAADPEAVAGAGPRCTSTPCGAVVAPATYNVREPFVAVDPEDARHVVVVTGWSRDADPAARRWIGYATTLDGGDSWTTGYLPAVPSNGEPVPYDLATDVGVAFANDGSVIVASLVFRRDIPTSPDLIVSRSDDGGLTFGAPQIVDRYLGAAPALILESRATTILDKPYLATDRVTGRMFVAWSRSTYAEIPETGPVPPGAIEPFLSRSDDNGLTWSSPERLVPLTRGPGVFFLGLTVAAEGEVVLVGARGPGREYVVFRSEDGGDTWAAPEPIAPYPSGGYLQQPALALWRVADATHAALAVPSGDASDGVSLFRSLDAGKTWSDPVEVAPLVKPTTKRNPALAVEPGSSRAILAFYDGSRAAPGEDLLDVLALPLLDGEVVGEPVWLTQGPAIPGEEVSEYMGLAVGPGGGAAVWDDWDGSAREIRAAFLDLGSSPDRAP